MGRWGYTSPSPPAADVFFLFAGCPARRVLVRWQCPDSIVPCWVSSRSSTYLLAGFLSLPAHSSIALLISSPTGDHRPCHVTSLTTTVIAFSLRLVLCPILGHTGSAQAPALCRCYRCRSGCLFYRGALRTFSTPPRP